MLNYDYQLKSFGNNINVAVVGASGGIGLSLVEELSLNLCVNKIFALSRSKFIHSGDNVSTFHLDLENEGIIASAASAVSKVANELTVLFVTSGILHSGNTLSPEKTWKSINSQTIEKVFKINTIGPALVAKHFLPLISTNKKCALVFLTARMGSIGDNFLGGWYSYRASKAGLNMIIKTLSIEMARRNANSVCVGLHPGTVDTKLSQPYQRGVKPGSLFSGKQSAKYLLQVLNSLSPKNTGSIFSWDGDEIPY